MEYPESPPDVKKLLSNRDSEGLVQALQYEKESRGRKVASLREEAARALGDLRDRNAVGPLLEALGTDVFPVARAAAEALARMGNPALEPLFQEAIGSTLEVIRHVETAFRRMDVNAVTDLLVVKLTDDDEVAREMAAGLLGSMGNPGATKDLVAALERDEEDWVRAAAAKALGMLGRNDVVKPLARALGYEDREVRVAAAQALARLGQLAVEALLKTLKDGNDFARLYAARALAEGKAGGEKAVKALISALEDKDGDVREMAAYALGEFGDAHAVNPLAELLKDEEIKVRFGAAKALERIPDVSRVSTRAWISAGEVKRKCLEVLIAEVEGKDLDRCFQAMLALKQFREEEAVRPLARVLGDFYKRDFHVTAVEALGSIGNEASLDRLIGALKESQDWEVRRSAARALGNLGNPGAVPHLIEALKEEDFFVVNAAWEALESFEDPLAVKALSGELEIEEEDKRAGDSKDIDGEEGELEQSHDKSEEETGSVREEIEEPFGTIASFLGLGKDEKKAPPAETGGQEKEGKRGLLTWILIGGILLAFLVVVMGINWKLYELKIGFRLSLSNWPVLLAGSVIGLGSILALSGILWIPLLVSGFISGWPKRLMSSPSPRKRIALICISGLAISAGFLFVGEFLILPENIHYINTKDFARYSILYRANDIGNSFRIAWLTVESSFLAVVFFLAAGWMIFSAGSLLKGEPRGPKSSFGLHLLPAAAAAAFLVGTAWCFLPRVERESLLSRLNQGNAKERAFAAEKLGEIKILRAFYPLTELLKDGDPLVREKAAWALGKFKDPEATRHLAARLLDDVPDVRKAAADAILKIGSPVVDHLISLREEQGDGGVPREAMEPILISLKGETSRERRYAVTLLGDLKDPRAVDGIISVLGDRDVATQIHVIKILAKLREPRAVGPLLALLKESTWKVRREVPKALAEIQDPRAVEPLLAALKDKDITFRKEAMSALKTMKIDGARAIPQLIEALEDGHISDDAAGLLVSMGEPAVDPLIANLESRGNSLQETVWALGEIGNPRAIQALIGVLQSGYQSDLVIKTLEKFGKPAGESLIEVLNSEDKNARFNAAKALGKIRTPGAVGPLIALMKAKEKKPPTNQIVGALVLIGSPTVKPLIELFQDEDLESRRFAIRTLGQIDDPRVVEPLLAALKDTDSNIRMISAFALGKWKAPRVVDALIVALKDEEYFIREDVVTSLGNIQDPRALEPLINAMADPHVNVRNRAREALNKFGDAAVEPLIDLLKHEKSDVRSKVAGILRRITGEKSLGESYEEWRKWLSNRGNP